VRRIRLNLLPGLEVEFADRDGALRRVEDWAREGTRWPIVIFGPEGRGKAAFLRQAASALRELGYDVFYLHLRARVFSAEVDDPTSRHPSPTLSGRRWRRNGTGLRWQCLTSRGR
jgi:hypothetical protein